jgi:hypothetical protein
VERPARIKANGTPASPLLTVLTCGKEKTRNAARALKCHKDFYPTSDARNKWKDANKESVKVACSWFHDDNGIKPVLPEHF